MTQDELAEILKAAIERSAHVVNDYGTPLLDNSDEVAVAILTALTARGLAVVPVDETMPMHASFDVDGGLGLEWENRKTHILVEVRGQAEVVWIIREGGKLIHGDEITVKAEPLPAALPKEGQ